MAGIFDSTSRRGYAAQALGLSPAGGGSDVASIIQGELAEQAKNRNKRQQLQRASVGAAAFDLLGSSGSASGKGPGYGSGNIF